MIHVESDTTKSECGRLLFWWRWSCSSCGATGSWLHDHERVERMAAAHAVSHVADEVRP